MLRHYRQKHMIFFGKNPTMTSLAPVNGYEKRGPCQALQNRNASALGRARGAAIRQIP
jgi:hypothetical protein